MSKFRTPENVLYFCTGSKCSKRAGKDPDKHLKHYLKKIGLEDEVEVICTECTDRCKFAPVLSLQPQNIWLKEYDSKDVAKLLENIKAKKISDIFPDSAE